MCLGIPAKLVKREGDLGDAKIGGVETKVCLSLIPEVKEGDYIILHAGFGIQIIDEEQAKETLKMIEELKIGRGKD